MNAADQKEIFVLDRRRVGRRRTRLQTGRQGPMKHRPVSSPTPHLAGQVDVVSFQDGQRLGRTGRRRAGTGHGTVTRRAQVALRCPDVLPDTVTCKRTQVAHLVLAVDSSWPWREQKAYSLLLCWNKERIQVAPSHAAQGDWHSIDNLLI